MKLLSVTMMVAYVSVAAPAWAVIGDAEVNCAYQADVVQAVRQARLNRVKERSVADENA